MINSFVHVETVDEKFSQTIMITRPKLLVACIVAIIASAAVTGQDHSDLPRVVILSVSSPGDQMHAFEEGLKSLGHINGTTINIEHHSTEGRVDKLAAYAEQAVALKPTVVVAIGGKSASAARNATRDIPIIAVTGDVSAGGRVKNPARPEGNITGLSLFQVELIPKRLEILLELAPRIRRLSVFFLAPINPTAKTALAALTSFANEKGIDINEIAIEHLDELKSELAQHKTGSEDALLIRASPVFDAHSNEIGRLTAEHRLVAMLPWKQYVHAGGLVSYSPDIVAVWRRASHYVDQILRGAKPGDLPVEHPTQYDLVINIGTAEKLGISVPASLLLRANEIIE